MKAVVVDVCGGPDALRVVHDFPRPVRKPGEVLVRLTSTSVNPIDTAIRSGRMKPVLVPKILGGDVAGHVAEAAPDSKFKPGDAVAALTPGYWVDVQGTYAQFVAVEESQLARVPAGVDLATAGGIPLVALTAWQSLMAAAPHQGQRCLVLAAAGGVGHMAVQLAKALGLFVVAVAGPANVDWAKKSLGADEVVDYSKQDFAEAYASQPFDIAIDCLPDAAAKCVKVLKPAGHYSHIANSGTDNAALKALEAQHARGEGPSVSLTLVKPNGRQLEEVLELFASHKVKLEVAKLLPLEQAAEGHRQVETGHTRGKVVLSVD